HEMRGQGLIETLPRLVASQARNCNPLERFVAGKKFRSSKPTLAEGAAVARPPRVAEMARALSESRGRVYSAPEEKLLPATETCWRYGLYVEPTSALGLTALEDLAQEESLDGRGVVGHAPPVRLHLALVRGLQPFHPELGLRRNAAPDLVALAGVFRRFCDRLTRRLHNIGSGRHSAFRPQDWKRRVRV